MSTKDIQAAIERARAVAAKLSSQIPDGGNKRSHDSYDDQPNKKFASVNDAVGAQLAMFKAQHLGGAGNGTISDEMKVPDNKVGLVIGKGGDQLHKLQAETSCKVQIAQADTSLKGERSFTIVGTRENIERCKKLIDDIIKRGGNPGNNENGNGVFRNNVDIMEIMIPGNKCGLVIGKGGETIKGLSEQYGVKLVVVQDPDTPQSSDKPLRITGEHEKVSRCKEAVLELINSQPPGRTNEYGSSRGGGSDRRDDGRNGGRDFSHKGGNQIQIKVPFEKAGLVIGKGGDSIREINKRTGAYVEIDRNARNQPEGSERMFIIKGTDEQIAYAQQLIYEKITGVQGSQPPTGYFADPSQAYPQAAGGANPWAAQQAAPAQPYQDPNAWAAYYQQYYAAAGAMPQAATAAAAGGAQAGSGGGTDYTQAWVDYYRSLGMHEQAEQILKQTSANGGAGTGASSEPTASASTSVNGAASGSSNGQATAPAANATNGTPAAPSGADAYAEWQQQHYAAQYANYANYYKQEGGAPQAGSGGRS